MSKISEAHLVILNTIEKSQKANSEYANQLVLFEKEFLRKAKDRKVAGTGQGDPEKVIPLADMFLRNLKMWLQSRRKLDVFGESNIRYLRESLEK